MHENDNHGEIKKRDCTANCMVIVRKKKDFKAIFVIKLNGFDFVFDLFIPFLIVLLTLAGVVYCMKYFSGKCI